MNLLIVDDQDQVLEGIKSSINWRNVSELDAVYYAHNVPEAKKIFLNRPIEILVSDIEMPGESGLELVAWVSVNFPETKCILLTAHANFDYAQDALRLKAIDYILQPVRYETLLAAVEKAAHLILQEQAARSSEGKQAFWDSFHEDAEQLILRDYFADGNMNALLEKALQLNLPLNKDTSYSLVLIDETLKSGSLDNWAEGDNKSLLLSLARHFYGQLTDYLCVFEQYSHHFWMLLHTSDSSEDFRTSSQSFIDFCRENYQISAVIYLGGNSLLSDLPLVYRNLYDLYRNNVASVNKLFTTDDLGRSEQAQSPMPASSSWAKYFCDQTNELVENAVIQYIRRTTENGDMNSRTLLALQQTFLDAFYESLHIRGIRIRDVYEQEDLFEAYTLSTRSTDDFLRFVRGISDYNRSLSSREEEDSSTIIETAQNYIAAHLSEELSRDLIARETHVSESYLSHLFPRETGLSLTDYITRERMILAKSLLQQSTLPVQMVAIKAGYNNISYFIRTFKKTYGVTPNDYRKKLS